jgi:hypothetical protein
MAFESLPRPRKRRKGLTGQTLFTLSGGTVQSLVKVRYRMALRDRIRRLEGHPSVEQKRSLVIFTLANGRDYTPKELEDFKATLDWRGIKTHVIYWDGERFISKGGNDLPQDKDLKICFSDKEAMELTNEIFQGIEPHEVSNEPSG